MGRGLLLCGLCGLLLCPAPLLGCCNACTGFSAQHSFFARAIAEGRMGKAGTARALEQGPHFFEAINFFIDSCNEFFACHFFSLEISNLHLSGETIQCLNISKRSELIQRDCSSQNYRDAGGAREYGRHHLHRLPKICPKPSPSTKKYNSVCLVVRRSAPAGPRQFCHSILGRR